MQDVELLLKTVKFQVVRRQATAEDGRVHAREVIRHPGAVVLLPILDDGRICLIRNFRVSVGKRLVELPAGTLEAGEDPLHAAHRELAEETGFRARSMELLTSFYASPGILDERMHLFLASGLEPGPTALEGDEDIQPLLVSGEEAFTMIAGGTIQDAKTLIGLLYYGVFRRKGPAGPAVMLG
ncbi:MAG: NUDIX hydrolase [Thermoguttaceae bacterium]